MSHNYVARLSLRLMAKDKAEILECAATDGIPMAELICAVVTTYLQWRKNELQT